MQVQTNQIENFVKLFQQGYEAWVEAGKIASSALEADNEFAEKVHKAHPEISCETIYAFDRMGRKELHPKLMISDSPGSRRLRHLPFSLQTKYTDEPVNLLIKTKNNWETLRVSTFNLTGDQASQVFDTDCVRSEPAQRAWLEGKASKAMITVDEPYRIIGNKLQVIQACQFTRGQLARILADMES